MLGFPFIQEGSEVFAVQQTQKMKLKMIKKHQTEKKMSFLVQSGEGLTATQDNSDRAAHCQEVNVKKTQKVNLPKT